MKPVFLITSVFIFLLFCFGTCKDSQPEQGLMIHNNSDQEIIAMFALYIPINKDTMCIKPTTKFEYEDFIYFNAIKSYSSKNFERINKGVIEVPHDTLYVGVFHRADMDAMSCEEFKEKYPIKKIWKLTKADAESANWMVTYP
jgi:hypothetical protein